MDEEPDRHFPPSVIFGKDIQREHAYKEDEQQTQHAGQPDKRLFHILVHSNLHIHDSILGAFFKISVLKFVILITCL